MESERFLVVSETYFLTKQLKVEYCYENHSPIFARHAIR
jgi:hypothetical protein